MAIFPPSRFSTFVAAELGVASVAAKEIYQPIPNR